MANEQQLREALKNLLTAIQETPATDEAQAEQQNARISLAVLRAESLVSSWDAQQPATGELEPYDAGLLNDFGGGNVEWWQDYIRAELGNAHDFYQSQITTPQPAQATQAGVTDSMIREAFLANGFTIKDGHSDLKPYVYAAARAILALSPERVPMTEDQVWHNDALMSANGTAGFKMDALMRIVRATEAHHFGITTQPKGGE